MPLAKTSRKKGAKHARTTRCAWNSATASVSVLVLVPVSVSVASRTSSRRSVPGKRRSGGDRKTVAGTPAARTASSASATEPARTATTTSENSRATRDATPPGPGFRKSVFRTRSFAASSVPANRSKTLTISAESSSSWSSSSPRLSSWNTSTTNRRSRSLHAPFADPPAGPPAAPLAAERWDPSSPPSAAAMSAVSAVFVPGRLGSPTRRAASSSRVRSAGDAAARTAACARETTRVPSAA